MRPVGQGLTVSREAEGRGAGWAGWVAWEGLWPPRGTELLQPACGRRVVS